MNPEFLHEFIFDLEAWTRQTAPRLWANKSVNGSPFYWPNGLPDSRHLIADAWERAYAQAQRETGSVIVAKEAARTAELEAAVEHFKPLAFYHADTLDRADPYYIGKDISYLAAKTEMKEFRLELDMLPAPRGFMMWEVPIGEAEPRGEIEAQINLDTGEVLSIEIAEDMMVGFRRSDTPINAVSWRLLPGGEEVLVVFYTDGSKAAENYRKWVAAQEVGPKSAIDWNLVRLQESDPQPLEREQVLPLGKRLAWFENKSENNRLRPTIVANPAQVKLAEQHRVGDAFNEAYDKFMPMLSQMVKTFVATLAIRRMKLASRVEIPAPKPSVKRMRRGGASEKRQNSTVELIRIGEPLRHRNPSGSKGGKWGVKTIVGPVIRTVQYVPAHDEYREGIWEIEPYIAGPVDAPWSEKARVFLLE